MTNLPSIYEEFAWHFVSTLTKVSSGWILLQIYTGPTQSKIETETSAVSVKESSLHLLNPDPHMIFWIPKKWRKQDQHNWNLIRSFAEHFLKSIGQIEILSSAYFTSGCHLLHKQNWSHNKWGTIVETRSGGHYNNSSLSPLIARESIIQSGAKLPFRFSLIGIHFIQSWTATTRHGVTRKRITKNRKNLQLISVC